tara:strand:+ start:61 stop:411 length:351 start_codon:yes stop_codon:yes gene_type:complete
MKWFQYTQNNSGGRFNQDDKVSHYVLIQAPNASVADSLAESVAGIYFNGVEDGQDCECCGDRWYTQLDYVGDVEPLIYGKAPFDESSVRIYPFGSFKPVSINDLKNLPKPMVIEPS